MQVSRKDKMENNCKTSVGKHEWNSPLGRHICRRVVDMKLILKIYGVRIWSEFMSQGEVHWRTLVKIDEHPYTIILIYSFFLYRNLTVSRFSFFFGSYTLSRTTLTSDRSVTRPVPEYRTTQTQNNASTHTYTHTHHTSIPEVGFEPTITASEGAKTVHASDRSATVNCYT
jgi:hypothetical protein